MGYKFLESLIFRFLRFFSKQIPEKQTLRKITPHFYKTRDAPLHKAHLFLSILTLGKVIHRNRPTAMPL